MEMIEWRIKIYWFINVTNFRKITDLLMFSYDINLQKK